MPFKRAYAADDEALVVNGLRAGRGVAATAQSIRRAPENLRARIRRGYELLEDEANPRSAIDKQCVEFAVAHGDNQHAEDAYYELLHIATDRALGARRLGAVTLLLRARHDWFKPKRAGDAAAGGGGDDDDALDGGGGGFTDEHLQTLCWFNELLLDAVWHITGGDDAAKARLERLTQDPDFIGKQMTAGASMLHQLDELRAQNAYLRQRLEELGGDEYELDAAAYYPAELFKDVLQMDDAELNEYMRAFDAATIAAKRRLTDEQFAAAGAGGV